MNGNKSSLGQMVDPKSDEIKINGKIVKSGASEKIYYALYKPRGIVSTASDELGRQTVTDLVPKEPRVYPVGRLDIDSEGLIILTNDGELTNRMTHPSFEHEKEYVITACSVKHETRTKENRAELIESQFISGLKIDNTLMKADSAEVKLLHDSCFMIQVVLHTGYNRQIRRMCAKIGLEVIQLTRVRVGKLHLADLDLKPGEYRQINLKQII